MNDNKILIEDAMKVLEIKSTQIIETVSKRVKSIIAIVKDYETEILEKIQKYNTDKKLMMQDKLSIIQNDSENYQKLIHKGALVQSLPISSALDVADDFISHGKKLTKTKRLSAADILKEYPPVRFQMMSSNQMGN